MSWHSELWNLIWHQRFANTSPFLVHYTSAEAAAAIIETSSIWLRQAQFMNDFEEIEHGITALKSSYKQNADAFNHLFDRVHKDRKDFEHHVDGWTPYLRASYIFSLSLHYESTHEARLGRLSMWRAYGSESGRIALVINPRFVWSEAQAGLYSAPVQYENDGNFLRRAIKIINDRLHETTPEEAWNLLLEVTRVYILCVKHPGFAEEQEWRVYHTPRYDALDPAIETRVKTVRSVPQKVLLVPLKKFEGIDLRLEALLHKVIVGPSEFAFGIRDAFVEQLSSFGIRDAEKRVIVSGIPLR